MNINEITLLEILMDCVCDQGTYAEYSLEGVSARTQMCDGTQIFQGVAFFLQRVIRSRRTLYSNLYSLDLKRLFCIRGSNQGTLYDDGSAYV